MDNEVSEKSGNLTKNEMRKMVEGSKNFLRIYAYLTSFFKLFSKKNNILVFQKELVIAAFIQKNIFI